METYKIFLWLQFAVAVLLLLWTHPLGKESKRLNKKNALRRKRMRQVYGDHL